MIFASLILISTTGFAGSSTSSTASGAAEVAASSAFSSSAAAGEPRASAPEQCPDHRAGLRFYRARHGYWLDRRGVEIRTLQGRQARSCPDAEYLAVLWRDRAAQARTVTKRWIARYALRDFQVCGNCNAWVRAVEQVQRPYPGTRGWLLSCSSPRSEGGHGRWVPNTQGSGAGGWLQFMESTFWRMFGAAKTEVAGLGYHVPPSASSWYSPLGQALGGAWAAEHGATGEWSGAGC